MNFYLFSSIAPQDTITNFNFTIESFDVTTPVPQSCTDISEDIKCISAGEEVDLVCQIGTKLYFSYISPPCDLFAIRLSRGENDGTDWASIYASFDGPKPNITTSQYIADSATLQSTDTFVISSLCTGQSQSLFITVDCLSDLTSSLLISPKTSNFGKYKLSDLTTYDSSFFLLRSSEIQLPSSNTLKCFSYTTSCNLLWYTHPTYTQPYYPLMPYFFLSNFLDAFELQNIQFKSLPNKKIEEDYKSLSLPINHNQYKLFVLLSFTKDDNKFELIKEDTLQQSKIRLLGSVTNVDGEPLVGVYSIKKRQNENICDYYKFKEVSTLYSSILKEYKESKFLAKPEDGGVFSAPYRFYALKYNSIISNCIQFINQFFEEEIIETTVKSTACTRSLEDIEFANDPCCSLSQSWKEGCVPRDISINKVSLSVIKNDDNALLDQCSNGDCVQTYLQDYSKLTLGNPCQEVLTVYNDKVSNSIQLLRNCKKSVFGVDKDAVGPIFCVSDHDCPNGTLCDITTNSCPVDRLIQEKQYLDCIFNGLDVLSRQDLLDLVEASNVDELLIWFKQASWLPLCLKPNNRGGLYEKEKNIGGLLCGCWNPLIDGSDDFELDTCWNKCYKDYAYAIVTFNSLWPLFGLCANEFICNWDSTLCLGKSGSECESLCNTGDTCMLCFDDQHCIEYSSITDPDICVNTNACIAPEPLPRIKTNTIAININEATCNATYSKCDRYCIDPICKSTINSAGGVCFNSLFDETTCTTNSGVFTDNICYFEQATTTNACTTINNQNVFGSCSSLTTQQCLECSGNGNCIFTNNAPKCQLEIYRECSKTECEQAGVCQGEEYLIDVTSNRYGGCIVPKLEPYSSSVINICPDGNKAIGKECINLGISTPSACTNIGGTWTFPSITVNQCNSHEGCYERLLDTLYQVFDLRGYSPKTETNCKMTGGQWKNMYTWLPARWSPPSMRHLKWTSKSSSATEEIVPERINFQAIYQFVVNEIVGQYVGTSLQSDMLCQFSQEQNVLSTVSCNCLSDNEDCFEGSQTVPTSTGQVCGFENRNVDGTYYHLHFTQESVELSDCATIIVSAISSEWFKSDKITLASSFARFKEPEKYPAYNEHDIIVGALLNDGVDIAISGGLVFDFQLCFDISDSIYDDNSKYSVYDFGIPNSDRDKVQVLDIQVNKIDNTVCSNIKTTTTSKNTTTHYLYFPIIRQISFDNTKEILFNKSTEGMLYTLAVLFLICSILGVSLFLFSTIRSASGNGKLKFNFVVLVGSLLAFNVIRCIYFFLVTAGISSSTLDYILVVLPTFLYFTAFSQIMIIWIILNTQSISISTNYNKLISIAVLVTNVALYSLFIIIVVVFDVSEEKKPDQCGNRFINEITNSVQLAVSLAYAIIIAFFFLVIGTLSFVFGFKLFQQMQATSKALNMAANSSSSKTLNLAIISFISFLLHCIFILVLVSISKPVVIFNFIAIIITEIFPSIYIYYSQFMFTFAGKNTSKNINVGSTADSTTTTGTSSTTTGISSTTTGISSSSVELNSRSDIEDI